MEAIVRAAQAERWPARIAAVISNRADASGLEFAASHGIATAVVANRDYPTRDQFDAALREQIDVFAPDLEAFPLLERALPLALHADLGPGDALVDTPTQKIQDKTRFEPPRFISVWIGPGSFFEQQSAGACVRGLCSAVEATVRQEKAQASLTSLSVTALDRPSLNGLPEKGGCGAWQASPVLL